MSAQPRNGKNVSVAGESPDERRSHIPVLIRRPVSGMNSLWPSMSAEKIRGSPPSSRYANWRSGYARNKKSAFSCSSLLNLECRCMETTEFPPCHGLQLAFKLARVTAQLPEFRHGKEA